MLLFEDLHHPWKTLLQREGTLYYKGSQHVAEGVQKAAAAAKGKDISNAISNYLKNVVNFSSGVMDTGEFIIAWTDHIRSWPIFYAMQDKDITIGTRADEVRAHCGLSIIDDDSVVEFAASGFIAGSNTIYQGLKSIQPGEFLIYEKRHHQLTTQRYFNYIATPSNTATEDDNINALSAIIDEIILEIIGRANGRRIWVPLSAGLDSRIILCKLHEHGYSNIQTFTYGPKYNFEAVFAKKIADKLNIPWRMVTPSSRKIRSLFRTDKRQSYWEYANNLKAIPCMGGMSAMLYLTEQGVFKNGDIFINGQSGDYITGGHIFPAWIDANTPISKKSFLDAIISKHYDLWTSFKSDSERSVIEGRIGDMIPADWEGKDSRNDRAAQLEQWEYDARQICYVVNGQRIYDFLGHDWELPLWDKRLVDFCQTLTLEDKKSQQLYKAYLKRYNYQGLFPENEPHIWRWSIPMLWVLPAAKILSLLGLKGRFYSIMRYFGHYADQYCVFPLKDHLKTFKYTRNVVSLSVRQWLLDHDHIPSSIKDKLR